MNRITPTAFKGPRAYFTAFDRRIVARTADQNALQQSVERRLKLLLFVKSTIVCAASHLTTDFAYTFFRTNPVLLSGGHIVPALRSDKKEIAELFDGDSCRQASGAPKFYQDTIATVVNWDWEDNATWFKDQFLAEIQDEQSLIRRQMRKVSADRIAAIVGELKPSQHFSRADVELASAGLPEEAKQVLLSFRELAYHMSGARVVNSESSLPQEDYLDFDLADLQQKRTRLTEEQILWKLFLETVIESFQRRMLPIEILDVLSFEDVLTMRQPILESTFQEQYDRLVRTVVCGGTPGMTDRLFDLAELEAIRQKLQETFAEVFDRELQGFLKKHLVGDVKRLGSVASSVALGAAGLIPGLGTAASAVSLLKDSPALLCNVKQVHASARSLSSFDAYVHERERLLKDRISATDISDKTAMLDMVDLFTATIAEKLRV